MFAALGPAARIAVLHGKEAFLIAEGTRRYAEALEAEFGTLGRFQFDGQTASLADVLDELRTFALLQGHKLVVVDHAEVFLAGGPRARDEADEAADGDGVAGDGGPAKGEGPRRRRALEAYAEHPCPEASLLLRSQTWRPGRLDKLIAKVGAVIKCEPVRDGQAIAWCQKTARDRHGSPIEAAAARRLVERLGPDLSRLDSEMAKLAAYAGEGRPIGEDAVAALVSLGRQEKAWILQGAILSGDPGTALSKLRELLGVSQVPYELAMWAVGDVLRRLHTAARALRAGASPGELRRQLQLFGASGDQLLRVARTCDPARLAQLLQVAVDSDVATKSGLGEKTRNLEVLTLHVADTIGCDT